MTGDGRIVGGMKGWRVVTGSGALPSSGSKSCVARLLAITVGGAIGLAGVPAMAQTQATPGTQAPTDTASVTPAVDGSAADRSAGTFIDGSYHGRSRYTEAAFLPSCRSTRAR